MIFGKHRIKADAHAQRFEINILSLFIHRRFGKPECFDGLFDRYPISLRKMSAQNGNDAFGHHSLRFGGNSGNDKNQFFLNRQGKPGGRAYRIGNDFRALREHGLFGVVFHPAQIVFGKYCL